MSQAAGLPPEQIGRSFVCRPKDVQHPAKLLWGIIAAAAFAYCAQAFIRADHALDRVLLLGLPGPLQGHEPPGARWLKELSWDMTALGSPGLVAVLVMVLAVLLVAARRFVDASYLLGSVGSGFVFGYCLKRAFGAFRPHQPAVQGMELSTSFPSGHAMLSALLGASLVLLVFRSAPLALRAPLTRCAIICAVLLSLMVGLSRVHLGLHWPSDVLAGWIAGAGWAVLFSVLVDTRARSA